MIDLALQARHDDQLNVPPVYSERIQGAGFDAGKLQVVPTCADVRTSVVASSNTIFVPGVGHFMKMGKSVLETVTDSNLNDTIGHYLQKNILKIA